MVKDKNFLKNKRTYIHTNNHLIINFKNMKTPEEIISNFHQNSIPKLQISHISSMVKNLISSSNHNLPSNTKVPNKVHNIKKRLTLFLSLTGWVQKHTDFGRQIELNAKTETRRTALMHKQKTEKWKEKKKDDKVSGMVPRERESSKTS